MHTSTALTAAWAALHTFQFGFAIAGLNGIQANVVCPTPASTSTSGGRYLAPCVDMTRAQFGLVVAIFTVGGLVGALSSRALVASRGQIGALRVSAVAVLIGSKMLAVANNMPTMVVARVIVGLGCGAATTTVPLVLADLAPAGGKKALGIMNQLFIVLGILVAQALSFPFGAATMWRGVPAFAGLVAIAQLVGSVFVSIPSSSSAEDQPLLGREESLTIKELLRSTDHDVRRGLPLVLVTQFFQQATGPTVVMYFSTAILSPVLPGSAKAIALAIVVWKVPMTIFPAFLIERVGTRPLLLRPTVVMTLSMLALGYGLNAGIGGLAVAGMVSFVTFFSMGLGPVTWVVQSEVLPPRAKAAASSLGLALNWSTNFVVGAAFLPLQQYLARLGDGDQEGTIFYVFAAMCASAYFAIRWGYRKYYDDGLGW